MKEKEKTQTRMKRKKNIYATDDKKKPEIE